MDLDKIPYHSRTTPQGGERAQHLTAQSIPQGPIKYASRLGKKEGADVEHDIMKICHYGLLALVALEKNKSAEND